jgi:hypothetical protein
MSSPSATQNTYPYQNEPTWSKSEKAIARTAFDAALKRELQDVMRETKQMANQIKEPADVWELEHYLTERRKEIDCKYDYRYSQLTQVFGRLLYDSQGIETVHQKSRTSFMGHPSAMKFLRTSSV